MGCNTSKRPKWKKSKNSDRSHKSGTRTGKFPPGCREDLDQRLPRPPNKRRPPPSTTEPSSTSDCAPEAVTVTPMRVTYYLGGELGAPLEAFTKINNNNDKTIAFKIVSSSPNTLFSDISTGTIPPRGSVPVTLRFLNDEEPASDESDANFRVFVAFSDSIPAEFKKGTKHIPRKHNGEFTISIRYSNSPPPHKRKMTPLPEGIVITPDVATFTCKQIGQPAECGILIMNKTKKYAAIKIRRPGEFGPSAVFQANPAAGIVPPGKRKCITLTFKNQREEKQQHRFCIFVALVDKNVLPDGFQAELIQPPRVYDGTKTLEVVFAKKDESEVPRIPDEIQAAKIAKRAQRHRGSNEQCEIIEEDEEEEGDGDEE